MTVFTAPALTVGQRVTPHPNFEGLPVATLGHEFVVRKVNRVNVSADPTSGGRGAAFPAAAWVPINDGETVADALQRNGCTLTPSGAVSRPFVAKELYVCGSVVTLNRDYRDYKADKTPCVVLKDDGGDRINVARLGGDEDRYVRVSRSGVTKRDLAWLTESLVDAA